MNRSSERTSNALLLEAVPFANRAVKTARQGSAMMLTVPIRRQRWMGPPLSWILPFRHERTYAIDTVGQEVWRWCNGHRTTEQIIERFARKYNVRFHDARIAVTQYLQTLVQRNLVVMVLPDKQNNA